jgi:tRNA nucleotidyltransferase/poly(A) polymerase
MSARSTAPLGRALPKGVRDLCATLSKQGHDAWVVGGCVRDVLMGRTASDWDVATTALPADVQRIFRRTIPTGIDHGTVTVLLGGEKYEVTDRKSVV